MNYLIIIISLLPIFLLALYFYKKDTIKEPKKLLKKLFYSGFLSALLVILFSIINLIFFPSFNNVENTSIGKIFIYTFIFVSLIEESCKLFIIYKFSYNDENFDQFFDIILYSVLVGLGFACFENILYISTSTIALQTALLRGITAVPAHACFQTFMGYYLSLNKFKNTNKTKKYFILSLVIPIILHGIYDFLLFSGTLTEVLISKTNSSFLLLTFITFLIIMYIATILKINKVVKIDKNILNENNCPNCNILITDNFCPFCGHKK